MFNIDKVDKVYIVCGPTDFRMQINGLCTYVEVEMKQDLYQNAIFVFCNRNRDKIKILQYDNGFWMHVYRLEYGRVKWPNNPGEIVTTIEELKWLLKGYEIRNGSKLKPIKQRRIM